MNFELSQDPGAAELFACSRACFLPPFSLADNPASQVGVSSNHWFLHTGVMGTFQQEKPISHPTRSFRASLGHGKGREAVGSGEDPAKAGGYAEGKSSALENFLGSGLVTPQFCGSPVMCVCSGFDP